MGHHIADENHLLVYTEETRYYPIPIRVKLSGKTTGKEPVDKLHHVHVFERPTSERSVFQSKPALQGAANV